VTLGRRIVVLIDGTDCSSKTNTNINQIRVALKNVAGVEVIYEEGFGYSSGDSYLRWAFNRINGLADRLFAASFDETVRKIYNRLCGLNIQPEDRVSVFGYSRGASVARSLCEVITNPMQHRSLFPRNSDSHGIVVCNVEFVGLFEAVIGPRPLSRLVSGDGLSANTKITSYVEFLAFHESRFYMKPDWLKFQGTEQVKKRKALGLSPNRASEEEQTRMSNEFALSKSRQSIWMPGKHADVGGQESCSKIAAHSLLTMGELFSKYTNASLDPNTIIFGNLLESASGMGQYDGVSSENSKGFSITKLTELRKPSKYGATFQHELLRILFSNSEQHISKRRRMKRAHAMYQNSFATLEICKPVYFEKHKL
jgi:hypothetical protein